MSYDPAFDPSSYPYGTSAVPGYDPDAGQYMVDNAQPHYGQPASHYGEPSVLYSPPVQQPGPYATGAHDVVPAAAYESPLETTYQPPAGYQAPGTYQDPGGYSDPSGYPSPAGYPEQTSYEDQSGYVDAPSTGQTYVPSTPAAAGYTDTTYMPILTDSGTLPSTVQEAADDAYLASQSGQEDALRDSRPVSMAAIAGFVTAFTLPPIGIFVSAWGLASTRARQGRALAVAGLIIAILLTAGTAALGVWGYGKAMAFRQAASALSAGPLSGGGAGATTPGGAAASPNLSATEKEQAGPFLQSVATVQEPGWASLSDKDKVMAGRAVCLGSKLGQDVAPSMAAQLGITAEAAASIAAAAKKTLCPPA